MEIFEGCKDAMLKTEMMWPEQGEQWGISHF
jgi:hypothetical protein